MIWDYLSQFWDSIVAVGEYPIAYFQNIGIAVAGALGSFFDFIFHNLSDFFLLLGWFGSNIKSIFISLLSPITYFFDVLRYFFTTAFSTAPIPDPTATYTFSQEILDVFNTIPNWSIFSSVLGAGIILIIGISGLKLLLKT